ncbi:MAG TPA: hypothetical protein PLD27_11140 [bacterium]|nr:hypothetical protein [bacterium]
MIKYNRKVLYYLIDIYKEKGVLVFYRIQELLNMSDNKILYNEEQLKFISSFCFIEVDVLKSIINDLLNLNFLYLNNNFLSFKKREQNNEIYYDYEKEKWCILDKNFIEFLKNNYPNIDLKSEFIKMNSWLKLHKSVKKKNFKKFIFNWLNKVLDNYNYKIKNNNYKYNNNNNSNIKSEYKLYDKI